MWVCIGWGTLVCVVTICVGLHGLEERGVAALFNYCMSGVGLNLVEGACLISVVTICRCCKTWWKGHV